MQGHPAYVVLLSAHIICPPIKGRRQRDINVRTNQQQPALLRGSGIGIGVVVVVDACLRNVAESAT
jgi:hypothetical protein